MTDPNQIKPNYKNINVGIIHSACVDCFASGQKRVKDEIGGIKIIPCPTCKGLAGKYCEWGSGEHRVSANMVALRKRGKI